MRCGFAIGRVARSAEDTVALGGFAVASAAARVWGRALGGSFERHGELTVVTGLPAWAFGRGGTCVGDTVLTARPMSVSVLEHEDVHRRQWRRFGLAFIPLYFAAGVDPLRNRFEIEADLVKGGYVSA